MQINIHHQHTNRFIHELDYRRYPPADLPRFRYTIVHLGPTLI